MTDASRKHARVDFQLTLPEQQNTIFVVELDEDQHKDRDPSCELSRLMEIVASHTAATAAQASEEEKTRGDDAEDNDEKMQDPAPPPHLCIARLNPDSYAVDGKHKTTPKKERYAALLAFLRAYEPAPGLAFSIVYAYYDTDTRDVALPNAVTDASFPYSLLEHVGGVLY